MATRTTYDHVLLIDLTPIPPHLHADCYTIKNSGIESVHKGDLKLTRAFRMRPLELPIYEPPDSHLYHVLAKVDSICNNEDRVRAARAVNDYLKEVIRTGETLQAAVESAIDNFPCRVLRGLNFANANEPYTKLGTSSRYKKIVSCTDTDNDASVTHQSRPGREKRRQNGGNQHLQTKKAKVSAEPEKTPKVAPESEEQQTLTLSVTAAKPSADAIVLVTAPAAKDNMEDMINESQVNVYIYHHA